MKDVEVYLYLHGITRSRATLSTGPSRIAMMRIDTDDIIDLVPSVDSPYQGVARVLVRIPYEVAVRHSIEPKTQLTSSLFGSDGARTIGTVDGSIRNDDRVTKEFVEKVMPTLDRSFRSGLDNLGQAATPQFPGLKQTRARSLNRQLQDDALNMEAAMLDDSDFSEHHE